LLTIYNHKSRLDTENKLKKSGANCFLVSSLKLFPKNKPN